MNGPIEAKFMQLPIDDIEPGKNVRVDDSEIDRLMESIRQHGVLQPITVVPTSRGNKVECLFGHRRLLASRRVGLEIMPCMVRPRGSDQARILTQLAENRERKNMTILEEARAFADLRKAGMSQAKIAAALGTRQPTVSAKLLLPKYPPIIQNAVHYRRIGLNDALSIPLEAADENDQELRAAVRAGSKALRRYVGTLQARAIADGGTPLRVRRTFKPINVDTTLVDEMNDAAERAGLSAVEWLTRVVRSAIEDQKVADHARA